MAKERHEPPPTSNNSGMAILVVGILLVGGLVAWALTRTVDVAPTPAPAQEAPVAVATAPLTTETAARNTPPLTMTPPAPVTMTSTTSAAPVAEHDNTQDKQAVPRIAAEDLRAKVNRGEVTLIDVRDGESYKTAHIPGALHIQFASLEGMIDTIPKGKPIVLYCT
jgi:hypothetical protein